jgi:branched-chain amino acid transport system permease protein
MMLGQILIGLINGSFYALLSLGLSIILGLLNIINFTHGVLYMMGAISAWVLLTQLGLGYWFALPLVPLIVGLCGAGLEKTVVSRIYRLEHLYGLLLTLGLATVIEGLFLNYFSAVGRPYPIPKLLAGAWDLGFMILPIYRAWIIGASIVVCASTWLIIERTKLGAYLRAATENPALVQAFGINVPRMVTITFAVGSALAGFAGVLAAPVYPVSPLMGDNIIIVVFAVVVIGGMGSIAGSIVTGFVLGVIEGLTKSFFPQASNLVIFVIMAIVLLVKPAGIFGRPQTIATHVNDASATAPVISGPPGAYLTPALIMILALCLAPFVFYPAFLMKALCFALFALSLNLLLGFIGLGSFGHAMFLGTAGYCTGYAAKAWGWPPEAAIVFGVVASAVLGAVVGLLSIRRQKIYFAMITLALGELVYFFFLQAPFSGGEDGLSPVPRGHLLGFIDLENDLALYYLILLCFVVGFFFVFRTIHSPFGQAMMAIRENEPRAISLGYNVNRIKHIAFILSAAVAGLAGALKVYIFHIASLPDVFHSTSADVILMVLVGGAGTIFGPIAGAFLIVTMQQYLAPLGTWVMVVQGAIFALCVLAFRQGVVGQLIRITGRPL